MLLKTTMLNSGNSSSEVPPDSAPDANQTPENENNEDDDKPDDTSLDEKSKAYIAKLRKENASHRVKAREAENALKAVKHNLKKSLGEEDEEDEDPEILLSRVAESHDQLLLQNAIMQTAYEKGIPHSGLNYFTYLVSQATDELDDEEELSEEKMEEIVAEVQSKSSRPQANSSVASKPGKAPEPNAPGGVTLDKFVSMGIMEKSKLFSSNPQLYNKLHSEAAAAKRLTRS